MDGMQIVVEARKRLLKTFPYFAFRAYQLELIPSTKTATMATDGKSIYVNENWVVEQEKEHGVRFIMTVIAHEVMHVDGFHHLRKGNRDHKLWNEAADYAINYALVRDGFDVFGGLYSTDYVGMSAEQIYTIINKPQPQSEGDQPSNDEGEGEQCDDGEGQAQAGDNGTQDGDQPSTAGAEGDGEGDSGSAAGDGPADPDAPWGEVWEAAGDDGQGMSDDAKAAAEREIASQVFEAAKAHEKIRDNGSGRGASVDQIINGFSGDPVPWHQHLKSAFDQFVLSEHTYARPNRRLLSQGLILPTQNREPNGELVVVQDVSYSMTQEELDMNAGHVQDIIDEVQPIRTVVIYCHETVCGVEEFDRHEELTLKIPEFGGTEFNPPFNYVERNDIEPCAMIYFTDGWGEVGPNARHDFTMPDYPVFWATTDRDPMWRGCEPFGEIIKVT